MIKVIIEGQEFPREKIDTSYEKKNEELKRQINSYPLVINRSVFKKTKEEKELVNNLRIKFKNRNK